MGYREKLVKMVAAAGKDLMEHAEDYVPGDTTWLQDLNISISFTAPMEDVEAPALDITANFIQKDVIDILINKGE